MQKHNLRMKMGEFSVRNVIKYIYNLLPFKKNAFQLIRYVWKPPEFIYKHLHFYGEMKVNISKEASFKIVHRGTIIENELFWNGINKGWEKESMKLWINLVQRSKQIVDIGSNTGLYSLVAAAVNPEAQIIAIDPVKRVFNFLQENVRINDFNIDCCNVAISNYNGKGFVYDTGGNVVLSVTLNRNLNSTIPSEKVEVDALRLDSLIQEKKIRNIDLMKIDVETHEPEVLEGMGEFLYKFQPNLLIEVLNDSVAERIRNLISGIDYKFFNIDEKKGFRETNSLSKSDGYNFLLLKRHEKNNFI